MKKINILGTEYTIDERTAQEDASLKDADAYCDRTTREIVVLKFTADECTIHDPEWYRKNYYGMKSSTLFCLKAVWVNVRNGIITIHNTVNRLLIG